MEGTMRDAAGRADAPAVVGARGVTMAFGDNVLFRDVTFEVRQGEVFVILGGSGSGKSTLLKLLIGLHRPTGGEIRILGEDLGAARGQERRELLSRIGVMWQSGALFGSMTLLENVMLPLEEHTRLPRAAREEVARVKLGLVGLSDAADRLPAEISGGMAKRAGIARAMALDPPLLFLDEPSAGLDPITSAGLDQLIRDLARDLGTTFIVVTHELQSILAIGDRCIMLDKQAKGMIAEGDPRALRDHATHPTVRAFFRREAA
ncbi:polyamine ABC transporter ATP-binding protein [Pseudoroseomonas rhizosphaerae]|uniref:Polyamine ABC transporter ATP-binding protein n=1 Tax=Teichococcus rhizosphaerae TaxID=1335062 RepID=A0A2C7A7X2_9PROT|nr:polyamine ABC transporter ATP-binding protein [Pseudoroseomonas rhizosphaerae]